MWNKVKNAATTLLGKPPSVAQTVIVLLAAGFGALLLNVAASGWLSSRSEEFADLTLGEQRLKTLLVQFSSGAQDAEVGQRGYLLLGDDSYLVPFETALRILPDQLRQIRKLGEGDPQIRGKAERIAELTERRLAIAKRTVDLARAGDRETAIALVRSGEGKKAMDELRSILGDLQTNQDRQIREGVSNLRSSSAWSLWVNLASLFLILGLGAVTAIIVLRYIRELNSARTDLASLNQGLERIVTERTGEVMRANAELQQFAYIVSHDLRSPLVNVMGFTSELAAIGDVLKRQQEIIAQNAPEHVLEDSERAIRDELPEAIKFIRASTAKMDRLINAILRLSREGRRALAPVRVNMLELVQGIAASLRHQTETAGAEIVVEHLPALVTDRVAIEQILSNVMENAVKYLDPGRRGRVVVSGREDGPFNEYRVEDNGRGIAAADRERVFELFRRAGKQDTTGEGLGLAFVRANVRRLGGSINLQSEPGVGTTFSLRFPRTLAHSRSDDAHVGSG